MSVPHVLQVCERGQVNGQLEIETQPSSQDAKTTHTHKQSKAKQSKAKQSKAKQSKAKQNKAKQSKTKQSKTNQNKAKQNKHTQAHAANQNTHACPPVHRGAAAQDVRPHPPRHQSQAWRTAPSKPKPKPKPQPRVRPADGAWRADVQWQLRVAMRSGQQRRCEETAAAWNRWLLWHLQQQCQAAKGHTNVGKRKRNKKKKRVSVRVPGCSELWASAGASGRGADTAWHTHTHTQMTVPCGVSAAAGAHALPQPLAPVRLPTLLSSVVDERGNTRAHAVSVYVCVCARACV